MKQELYMIGLHVRDIDATTEFYRQVGLSIPSPNPVYPHVPVQMTSPFTFFMDSRAVPRDDPELQAKLGDYKILFEFYLATREEVDAKYNHMISLGYPSYHAPFETAFGMYFALIDDPDGNTVLFSTESTNYATK